LERGLETLTGIDFVDGPFAVGGAVLAAASVNRELVEAAADNMRKMFGKEPQDLTRDEWEEYKRKYPRIPV